MDCFSSALEVRGTRPPCFSPVVAKHSAVVESFSIALEKLSTRVEKQDGRLEKDGRRLPRFSTGPEKLAMRAARFSTTVEKHGRVVECLTARLPHSRTPPMADGGDAEKGPAIRDLAANPPPSQGNSEIVGTKSEMPRLTGQQGDSSAMTDAAIRSTYEKLLLSQHVQKVITKRLRKKGVFWTDLEDQQQRVTMSLLRLKEPLEKRKEVAALAWKAATDRAASYHRAATVRRIRHADPPEDGEFPDPQERRDAEEFRAIELKERAEVYEEAVARGDIGADDVRILTLDAVGESDREIARRTGLATQTIRNKLARARRVLSEALRARDVVRIAGAVVLLGIAILIWLGVRRYEEAHLHRGEIQPDDEYAPPAPSPTEIADGLRKKAVIACDALDVKSCERDLDEAKRLDPAGEGQEQVMELRERIESMRTPPADPSKEKEMP
jgi:DNA-directed RNA polymerase specialized sigma24 family protein